MDLPDKAYFSNFIVFNKHQRKILKLFIHMTNARPMTLQAEGFFMISLNLNTFITVIFVENICQIDSETSKLNGIICVL